MKKSAPPEYVLIDVLVDDNNIGHFETVRGKIIAERIARKKRRGKEEYDEEYAVQILEPRIQIKGTIFWKPKKEVTRL